MYKRAQNILEVVMLASMVTIIGFSLLTLFNNQKTNIANMSKVKVTEAGGISSSVNPGPGSPPPEVGGATNGGKTEDYEEETAGTSGGKNPCPHEEFPTMQ